MKTTLRKKVQRNNLYSDFVNILNGVLQLSPREAEVFSYLLMYSDNGYENNVNHKEVRDNIISKTGVTEANLSRYLNTIKTKGLIIKGKNSKWIINDNIKPYIQDKDEEGNEIQPKVEVLFILNILRNAKEDVKISSGYTKSSKA